MKEEQPTEAEIQEWMAGLLVEHPDAVEIESGFMFLQIDGRYTGVLLLKGSRKLIAFVDATCEDAKERERKKP